MSQKKNKKRSSLNTRSGLSSYLRKPAVQGAIVLFVAIIVYLIASAGGGSATSGLANEVSVDKAYEMYQSGVFTVDVRTQEEWDEYHAPNTTLIPLDELPSRLSELPADQEIVVICRSGNRSQTAIAAAQKAGRSDIRLNFDGGIKAWASAGGRVTR